MFLTAVTAMGAWGGGEIRRGAGMDGEKRVEERREGGKEIILAVFLSTTFLFQGEGGEVLAVSTTFAVSVLLMSHHFSV